MTSVAVAVTDGMPLFELAAPCAIFGIEPGLADPCYDFAVCAAPSVRVGGWLRADTQHGLDDLACADTVIVPACHDVEAPPPAELVEAVRTAHDGGARVASICTGAFVLAAAGLLDGRRATTHWMHAARLAARHPAVEVDPGVLYIDEGDVLTSAGKAAGIDLCLHSAPTTAPPLPMTWPAAWSSRRTGPAARPSSSRLRCRSATRTVLATCSTGPLRIWRSR